MAKKPTNGGDDAFPVTESQDSNTKTWFGLTKREYFAIHALQGLLAESNIPETVDEIREPHMIADEAVTWADLLIDALNKGV